MRLIYPIAALVGVLVCSACSHHSPKHSSSRAGGKDYALSFEQVREAAQDGDADAQYALGYMYYYGQNVTRNGKQARFWIGRAASQHHKQAMRALNMLNDDNASSPDSGSTVALAKQPRWETEHGSIGKFDQRKHYKETDFSTQSQDQNQNKNQVASGQQRWEEVRNSQQGRPAQKMHFEAHESQGQQAQASAQSKENSRSDSRTLASEQNNSNSGKSSYRNEFRLNEASNNRSETSKSSRASAQPTSLSDAQDAQMGYRSKGRTLLTRDEQKILSTPDSQYTVQLFGTSSRAAVQRVIASNNLQNKAKVYHSKVNGKDFYGLIYGTYPSQAAAKAEINRLPANLKKLNPWAKPYESIKASIGASSTSSGRRTG